MKEIISVIAGVLAVVAIVPYISDIVRGKTKPNVVSWLTWTVLLVIATSAAFAAHQPRSAILTLGDLIGTGTTLVLGLKYGIAKFSWLDGICQGLAVVGLLLWFIFNSPEIAIISAVIIDFIASVPTIHHSWLNPEEETYQTFLLLVVASGLTLISLTNLTPAALTFPVYILLINATIAFTVVMGRKQKNSHRR